MRHIKARALEYTEDEEHLLRRLGGAVVVLWESMSEVDRESFLSQATMMADRHETVQLREQLKYFIKNAKVHE